MKLVQVKEYRENIGTKLFDIFPQKQAFDLNALEAEDTDSPEDQELVKFIHEVPDDNKWHHAKYGKYSIPVLKKPGANRIFANKITATDGSDFYALICYTFAN